MIPFPEDPPRPSRVEIAPGAVHLPGWLSTEQQRTLVTACREWAKGPVPMRHTRLPGGGVMSVQTVHLGWYWRPYRYTRTADDHDGARVAELPAWLADLGRQVLAAAYQDPAAAAAYHPDVALVNYYDRAAKMGLHQDKEERTPAPVVSLSVGDRCVFRLGNTETRNRPWTDIELSSGDAFVFGGPSRFAYHGVPKLYPNSGPGEEIGLPEGRLNLTLRVTGLPG
ncbi:MAG TPA: alpha-ketoglutarate-dependent dioxygenase AlkB [Actinospica sp.]|nr:alpha-ketoglutarate-dependent dioxygenase AlkB [Actinospica sp.]